MKLTQDRLKELLHYDLDSGIFIYKVDRGRLAKSGQVAGSIGSKGYIKITVDGKEYSAHRLVYLYMEGRFPAIVDHINRDRADNRVLNLREVSLSLNSRNTKLSKANSSGVKGVSWYSTTSRWRAYINGEQGKKTLGYFKILDEAIAARKQAELTYGYL